MIKVTQFGEVTRFELARKIAGRGRYWSMAYYVDGLLIDAGTAHTAHELVDALDGRPLSGVINTHSHEDHIGANYLLQERFDQVPIYAHPRALPILADPAGARSLQPYRHILFGQPEGCAATPVENGQEVHTPNHTFRIIYTPGHTPDHICLYEPERKWLFSGDLYVGGKDRALRNTIDIRQILASLKMVAQLPAKVMFPSCARVKERPRQDIQDKIEYLEIIGQRILELHRQGLGPKAIARKLFGGPRFSEWMTLGNYSRLNLVQAYLKLYGCV